MLLFFLLLLYVFFVTQSTIYRRPLVSSTRASFPFLSSIGLSSQDGQIKPSQHISENTYSNQ